jgi:hypothetical protein
LAIEGSSVAPAAGGKERRGSGGAHRGLAGKGGVMRWRVGAGGSVPCRVSGGVGVVVWGAGLVKLRGVASSSFSRGSCSSSSAPSLWCGGGGREKGHGWLGFRAAASGVLLGRFEGCGAGPDAEGGDARRPWHGHAARIPRLRREARVCGAGGRGVGEKGGARAVALRCRGAGTGARGVTQASGAQRKGERRFRYPVARRWGAATRGGVEPGCCARKKGEN